MVQRSSKTDMGQVVGVLGPGTRSSMSLLRMITMLLKCISSISKFSSWCLVVSAINIQLQIAESFLLKNRSSFCQIRRGQDQIFCIRQRNRGSILLCSYALQICKDVSIYSNINIGQFWQYRIQGIILEGNKKSLWE